MHTEGVLDARSYPFSRVSLKTLTRWGPRTWPWLSILKDQTVSVAYVTQA
jgi:hypothetical protein